MTLPQVKLILRRAAVRDAEQDHRQLHIINTAAAPLVTGESGPFQKFASHLRDLISGKSK